MVMEPSKRFRSLPSLTIVAVLFLTLSPFKNALAQKPASYLERLNLASQMLSQTASPLANSEELWIVQDLLKLSPAQVHVAMLQSLSAQSVSDGGAGDGSGLQGGLSQGAQTVRNTTSELCVNHTTAFVMALLEQSHWARQSE